MSTKKHVFWIIITAAVLVLLYPLIMNRPRCLEYKTEVVKRTYYDFSESGTGVTEGDEKIVTCVKWENKGK